MASFEEIKAKCLAGNILFEDHDFPARNSSISPKCDNPGDWLWRRPTEISDSPVFVSDGACRFDLVQGESGDCWFIAACAVLATRPDLFTKVVPSDQEFQSGYAGIFKFNFWRYGDWTEVYVDDRLPISVDNSLRFGQNRSQPNEFWGALLEKAYAKLHGSYHAINHGLVRDALVDMTGGISEDFNLRWEERLPPDLFEILKSSHGIGSLMTCGIWGDGCAMNEELMWNGLYKGHAYCITGVVQTRIRGWHVQLLRLRNPWGEKEWTGPWSNDSDEWLSLSSDDKTEIGLTFEDDGEFWIAFHDFLSNFHGLDIVHSLQKTSENGTADEVPDSREWYDTMYNGKWIKGINAGGSSYLGDPSGRMYYTNPQYIIVLQHPDEDDVGGDCTCVVSLLQKDCKRRKMGHKNRIVIGFDVHQVKSSVSEPLNAETYFENAKLKKQIQPRTIFREVSNRFQLSPGTYCIIPNTLKTHQEGEFLLRIFTYDKIDSGALDKEIAVSQYKRVSPPIQKPVASFSSDMFVAYAGDDFIDARDLRDLLSELARKEFGEMLSFGVESCRSLVAMMDKETTGVLDYEETINLWEEILHWKKIFKKYDRDKCGCIETYELRHILRELGFHLRLDTLSSLVVRYGGKDRSLFFEDFCLCLAKTLTIYGVFMKYSSQSPGHTVMTLDQWFGTMLYL